MTEAKILRMDDDEFWRDYKTTWRDWRNTFILFVIAIVMVSIPTWVFP